LDDIGVFACHRHPGEDRHGRHQPGKAAARPGAKQLDGAAKSKDRDYAGQHAVDGDLLDQHMRGLSDERMDPLVARNRGV
jgi:hypothetical protein